MEQEIILRKSNKRSVAIHPDPMRMKTTMILVQRVE